MMDGKLNLTTVVITVLIGLSGWLASAYVGSIDSDVEKNETNIVNVDNRVVAIETKMEIIIENQNKILEKLDK